MLMGLLFQSYNALGNKGIEGKLELLDAKATSFRWRWLLHRRASPFATLPSTAVKAREGAANVACPLPAARYLLPGALGPCCPGAVPL